MTQIKNIALKSGKTKIAVIGKGQSIQAIHTTKLEEFFIININDSEKILPGDIALIYRPDFYDKIKSNNFSAGKYFAPPYLKIPDHKHIEVTHVSSNQDSIEHIYDYFEEDGFFLRDFIILSAIKFSILYQKAIEKQIEVFFIGFDFHSENMKPDQYQMHDLVYTNIILKTQESFFLSLLDDFNGIYPEISLIHVGDKSYSGLSVSNFNSFIDELENTNGVRYELTNSEMYSLLLKEVRENGKVIIVAEFTNNHIGDSNRLIKMIELAKESGADIIKVQKRDVDTFYTPQELAKPYKSPFGNTLGAYRRGVEMNEDLFKLLDSECRKNGIPWFTSVLDWNSYEFMLQFDVPIIKLPSTISNHKNYLLKISKNFKGDLVISTGFTEVSYERFVLDNFMTDRNLFLLQCTSSYPTPPEACQVSVVRHYEELSVNNYPNLFSGYSSHDIGSLGCMLAVAAGAKMVEKHVKLGDLDWVHFDGVAIDLFNNKFKDFVHDVHKAELMCGGKHKLIHQQENHKYLINNNNN